MPDLSQISTADLQAMLGQHPTSQPAAPAPSAAAAANAQGEQAGQQEGSVLAAIGQAAHQGTFGLNDYINAGVRSLSQGDASKDAYAANLEYSRGRSQGEAEAHPIAGTVGGVAGAIMGGGALSATLKAARVIPGVGAAVDALAPVKGQAVSNVAKSAAVNGVLGYGIAKTEGENTPQAAQTAGLSAIAGPVMGKAIAMGADRAEPLVSAAISKLVPRFNPSTLSAASRSAFNTLADNIDMSQAELAAAYDSVVKLTGNTPSMAMLTNLKTQGNLKALAAANPQIASDAIAAVSTANAPFHEQLAAVARDKANMIAQGRQYTPQSSPALLQLRDDNMTAAMNKPDPITGQTMRGAPVSLQPKDLSALTDPAINVALGPDTRISASQFHPGDAIAQKIVDNALTVGDIDAVREALRSQQKLAYQSGGFGKAAADTFGNAANKVEGIGRTAHPDYGPALDDYRTVSRYADGFSHGLGGGAFDDATDPFTRKSLQTSEGKAGYNHGVTLKRGTDALEAIAPSTVQPAAAGPGPATAAHAVHAVVSPSPLSLASVTNSLTGKTLPQNVQAVISRMLFSNDPVVVQQGIKNLARAGVSAADIRRLGAATGAVGAAHVAQHLSMGAQ